MAKKAKKKVFLISFKMTHDCNKAVPADTECIVTAKYLKDAVKDRLQSGLKASYSIAALKVELEGNNR